MNDRLTISSTLLALAVLSGCGQSEAQSGRPPGAEPVAPVPAASAPKPAPAPAPPVVAAPPPVAPVVVAPPATSTAPLLLDLAAAGVLDTIRPSGQAQSGARIVDADGGKALEFTCAAGSDWPGILIKPAAGVWDLSASSGVELALTNTSASQVQIGLRVDEQGGNSKAWNGEVAKLAPGASTTLRVRFGQSWGAAGYAIDAKRIASIQVYAHKPGEDCVLRISSLVASGKAGDKPAATGPKAIPTHRPPADPRALSFATPPALARFRLQGAELTMAEGAATLAVATAAARAEAVYRPAAPLDLRDFDRAVFAVRNPGTTLLRVQCRLEGAQGDRVSIAAEIPAGERREITLPFAGAPWQGVSPAKADAPAGAAFTGAPVEQSSTGLVNDAVASIALAILEPAAGTRLVWEGVSAAASGPAEMPAWLGTRPPVDGDWVAVLDENFTGSALDTTRWTPRLPWIGPIPYELQRYNDKNVSVADGHLVIRCSKQTGHLYDNPAWPSRDYTTGAVTSYGKWSMHYGYTEARMKLPKALGLWPAFWTMPDRGPLQAAAAGGDWQSAWEATRSSSDKNRRRSTDVDGMEMDIMEHVTRFGPFRYNTAAHWDGYGKDHKSVGTSRNYAQPDKDGYIVAGLLWEPGRLTWFCNGKATGSWADPRVGSVPASLKFTVQMGGWAGNEVDDTALPDDFKIDWVRAWQLRERLPAKAVAP